MTDVSPQATILLPVRNEANNVEGCLEAVARQDVGASALAVVVADGGSTDETLQRLKEVSSRFDFASFEIVDNPAGGIGAGLNAALRRSATDVVVRVDARSRIGPSHVRLACEILAQRSNVAIVGGGQMALDQGSNTVAAGIARALRNRWTTGMAKYRTSSTSQAVDTVWMGVFRRDVLISVGAWNEALVVNEDYELCERIRASGNLVWYDSRMLAGYRPRTSWIAVSAQYRRYGWTKGRRWKAGAPLTVRHAALLAMPPVGGLILLRSARWIRLSGAAAVGVVAAFVLDELGSDAPAPIRTRVAAVVSTGVICGSWWGGSVAGLLAGRRMPVSACRSTVVGGDAPSGGKRD